jgi:hypothetical protein
MSFGYRLGRKKIFAHFLSFSLIKEKALAAQIPQG